MLPIRPIRLGALAFSILVALLCVSMLPAGAWAQAAAPALDPGAAAVLQTIGLGKYAAAIASLVALVGFVVSHLLPWLPVAAPGSTGMWAMLRPILSAVAGNYRNVLKAPPPITSQGNATMKTLALLSLLALASCLTACANDPTAATDAAACLAAVAPVVAADAASTGSAASKGVASGLAVVTSPVCLKAVQDVSPAPAVVAPAPAAAVVPVTP